MDNPKSHSLVTTGYNSSGNKLVFTDSSAAFAGKTFGSRNVIVRKGAGSFTTNAAMNIGDSFLPCTAFNGSSNNALHSMYHKAKIYGLKPLVWIDIAESGSVVETIVRAGGDPVNATTTSDTGGIQLAAPVHRVVPSGTTFYLDWVGKTSSISANSQVLTFQSWDDSNVTLGVFPSNSAATLVFTSVQQGLHSSQQVKAFSDSFIEFRKGSRYQKGSIGENNAPSVSYMINPNLGEQHMFSGIRGVTSGTGSSGSTVLKINPNSTDTVTAQAAQIIRDADFNFGQTSLSEIDSFDIDIEFPGGLYARNESGGLAQVFVEFQVIFKYKNSAGADFTEVLIKGVDYGDDTDGGGVRFVKDIGYDNNTGSSGSEKRFRLDLGKQKQSTQYWRHGSGTIVSTGQTTAFIHTFSFDVAQFQPFVDWEIEVRRLVPGAPSEFWSDNKQEQAQATSRIKLVNAKVHDRLSYPLTAYAVAGFSAQDFPTPPKRSYKLKGRKIKVPTNYLTRDETRNVQASYKRNVSTGAEESGYQTWDGKFRGDLTLNNVHPNYNRVYCNNPAWVFYDILTDKDYGLGEHILESDIDKYALYQIARYCDELVPDGKGGQEPRFACNVYLQKETEAYKVLKDLSSTFRSMMYWVDGQITLVQDRPKEPVYTFTTGNIEGGVFNYSYTGSKARINQVRASWNNPEELYKQTLVSVDDIPNIAEQGKIISKDVVAYGCTSEAQAKRVAQWHLETETRETEVVSFATSLNGAYLRPGDIINVQDKRVADIEASGRVTSGSTSSIIRLDRTVTFPGGVGGNQCNLYLIYPDPGIYLQQETATINSVTYSRGELIQADASANSLLTGATQEKAANLKDDSGNSVVTTFAAGNRVEVEAFHDDMTGTSSDFITTAAPFAGGAPAADTIWAISRENTVANTEIKKYRIVSISQPEINKYEISATQYVAEKFDEIEAERPVVTSKYLDMSSRDGVVPPPADIVGVLELNPDTKSYDAVISWSPPTESVTDTNGSTAIRPYRFLDGFEISTSLGHAPDSSNAFSSLQGRAASEVEELPGTQTTFKVKNVVPGRYVIRINTINDAGTRSKVVSRVIDFLSSGKGITNRVSQLQYAKGLSGTLSHDGAGSITVSAAEIQTENNTFATAAGTFDFTGGNMPNSSTGFLYLDSSGPTLRRVVVHEDGTSNHDFAYLKEVGAANNGLALATGRVTLTEGSTKVVGVSGTNTVFNTDFAVGDLIKFSTTNAPGTQVANSDYRTIVKIESNDVLYVDAVLFDRTGSGGLIAESNIYIHKQLFKPDFEQDSIVAKITKNSGGAYALEKLPYVPTTANATRNDNKGPWDASTTYSLNDLVTHNGRSYIALQTASGSGQAPTGADTSNAYWSLFAAKGDTGITGASINFAFVRVPHGTTASDVVASTSGTSATPANFTVSSVSYTWSDTIPTGTGTLYTVEGSKTPPATGFVWGTPRQLEGDSHAELIIYSDVVASGGSAPADPTACTYNFTTGVLTIAGTNASSWNKIPPSLESAADESKIFAITVVVSGAPGDTAASISASEWSAAFVYARHEKGETGETGEGNEVIYYVSKSAPSTPSASTVAGIPTGWFTSVPTATENVWVSLGSRAAGATNYTWGAPSLLQEVTSNILLNQKMLPWVEGTGHADVPGGQWAKNGTTSENTQSLLTDPFGGKSVIWRAINSGSASDQDGGFNGPRVEISPTQNYRFSLFINQKDSTNGTVFFGLNGYNASNTNTAVTLNNGSGNTSTNPYFFSGDLPALDKWYLFIGHVVPHNDTGNSIHPDSGLWDVATGKKVDYGSFTDYKFQSTHTKVRMRAYQYYNTSSASDEVHFFAPRIDIADERMPSVQDLLRTSAVPSNTATVYAYKKANSDSGLLKPSTTRTYTFDTGAFNDSALGNSWSSTIAGAGSGDNVYICQAQVTSEAATVSVSASDWSDVSLLTEKGATGAGNNFIFKRSATNPNPSTPPTANGLSVPTGWDDTPGASSNSNGEDILWASKGTLSVGGTAYSWSTAYQIEGSAIAEIKVYSDVVTNNGSSPSKPTTSQSIFNFTTSTLTVGNTNWNESPPGISNDGDTVYVCTALVTGSPSDTSVAVSWTTPTIYARKTDGSTGASVNIVFARSATQPNAPTASPGVPNQDIQWYDSSSGVPGTDVIWASRGSKAVGATNFTWTTPFQLEGEVHAEVYVYKKSSNETSVSGGSYNFTNNTLTVPSGWSKNPPGLTADGDKVYVSVGLVTGSSLSTSATITWGTPVVYAQRTDGTDGGDGASALPSASTLIDYDDLETTTSYLAGSGVHGKWFFLSSIADANGSFGNEFDELQNATQIGLSNVDADEEDQSIYYSQVETGDILTARINDTAWVAYRITAKSEQTGYYTFNVTPISTNGAGYSSNNLQTMPGSVVEMRFSRAGTPTTVTVDVSYNNQRSGNEIVTWTRQTGTNVTQQTVGVNYNDNLDRAEWQSVADGDIVLSAGWSQELTNNDSSAASCTLIYNDASATSVAVQDDNSGKP